MPEKFSGFIFKLTSNKGTLLGSVIVPPSVPIRLARTDIIAIPFCDYPNGRQMISALPYPDQTVMVKRIVLGVSHHMRDALTLYEGTLEELELCPEYFFIPGAAYLRSLSEAAHA